jgi:transketolase
MPSWELFEQQPASYRDEILPSSITARVAVEAGVPMGWERYMGPQGIFIGIHTFGTSAPYEIAYRHFGITADAVVAAARRTLV